MSTKVTKEQMESLILAEFYFRGDEAALETTCSSADYVDPIGGTVGYAHGVDEGIIPAEVAQRIEDSLSLMTFCIIVLKKSKHDNATLFIDASAEFVRSGLYAAYLPQAAPRDLGLPLTAVGAAWTGRSIAPR